MRAANSLGQPGRAGRLPGQGDAAGGAACGVRGFGAREASSDAFFDGHPSNRVSHALGYVPNGATWDTRRGEPAEIKQWRLMREQWISRRRDDIELVAVGDCLVEELHPKSS